MAGKERKSLIKNKKLRKIQVKARKNTDEQISGAFSMNEKTRQKTISLGVGAAVGAANSLFGGGGGMLAVPLLQKTGYAEKQAHATAILVILPVSLLSFLLYYLRGFCDFSVVVPTALGVTVGGFLGACLLGKLPTKTVQFIFSVLQAAAGLFLLFGK